MRIRLLAASLLLITMATFSLTTPGETLAVSCDPCAGVVLENLNLREGPSTSDEVILVMPAGSEIEYVPGTAADNGFREVTFEEDTGWASLEFLQLFPAAATTDGNLNLRDGDSTSDEILEVMPDGSNVTVLGTASNGFYSVDFEGTTGFAFGEFLVFTDAPVGEFEAGDMIVANDEVRLREGPSTSEEIVLTFAIGDTAEVLSGPTAADGFDWYEVDTGTEEGWAAGDFFDLVTVTPVFEAGDMVVTIDRLRLRADSSLDAAVITTLDPDTSLEIISGPVSADGYNWYEVDAGAEGEGWVAGEFLELEA